MSGFFASLDAKGFVCRLKLVVSLICRLSNNRLTCGVEVKKHDVRLYILVGLPLMLRLSRTMNACMYRYAYLWYLGQRAGSVYLWCRSLAARCILYRCTAALTIGVQVKEHDVFFLQFSSVQSLDRLGHQGDMRADSTEILCQSFPQDAPVSSFGTGRDVHCLMSLQHFLCGPQRRLPHPYPYNPSMLKS